MELAPVEKMIIYIPVADATYGGHPILNNNGLKILPPPSPSAPETQPPTNDKETSLMRGPPDKLTSLVPSPPPCFFFRDYSHLTLLIEYHDNSIQIMQ